MKILTKITLMLVIILFASCGAEKEEKLELTGKVVGVETNSIVLIKPGQDHRFDPLIEIPVKNGKFYYETKLEYPEAVHLAFAESVKKGMYRPIPLFLENKEIQLTLYPEEEEFDKNIVEGGTLNAEHRAFQRKFKNNFEPQIKPIQDSLNKLGKNGEYFSDELKKLNAKIREKTNDQEKVLLYKKQEELYENGQYLTPKARALEEKLQPVYNEQIEFQQQYINSNPTIVSYYYFLDHLIFNKESLDVNSAKKTFHILSEANPNHPYNELAFNLIEASEKIKVGKRYTDFSAPTLTGEEVLLSEKIDGKIALLDLWATWCRPCIANSRTMIPLYEEYKNKGFTIIGVAGEYKTTDNLVKFLEKEKWPWLNLVELDRKNAIWQKYNTDGSGGAMFLIDEKGIIIAKDPTAEEVRIELESRLN